MVIALHPCLHKLHKSWVYKMSLMVCLEQLGWSDTLFQAKA